MKLEFVKLEGGGNDFILFDMRNTDKDLKWNKIVAEVCKRKHGIGADGVLLIEDEPGVDFRMRIFNPDGGEAEMCGNGARCCALYYARTKGVSEMKFNTMAGMMKAEMGKNSQVKLSLPSPTQTRLDILLKLADKKEMGVSFINTGVPHVIVETNKLEDIDVNGLGRQIRYHNEFAPAGTNADFVEVTGEHSLKIRTYERGVEEETLACGTGVIASAVISSLKGRVTPPVEVLTRGGEKMKVYFKQSESEDLLSRVNDVKLEGKVNRVFSGSIELPE